MLTYLTLLSNCLSNYHKHYCFKTFFSSASSLFKMVSCFIPYPLALPCGVVTNVEFLVISCAQHSGNQGDDSALFISSSSGHFDGFSESTKLCCWMFDRFSVRPQTPLIRRPTDPGLTHYQSSGFPVFIGQVICNQELVFMRMNTCLECSITEVCLVS